MEFYSTAPPTGFRLSKFQFPTGWNSTLHNEPYALTLICFNSQRDGILRYPCRVWDSYFMVSIPNGMEFYSGIFPTHIKITESFNSQRDGILLTRKNSRLPTAYVSIPNGMEFYQISKNHTMIEKKVSIPNGMEFYHRLPLLKLASHSFNSQRDGILHNVLLKRFLDTLFQFPTGWNSTILSFGVFSFASSFNSQRDGILLYF